MNAVWTQIRIATLPDGTEVLVSPGKKGPFDFRVRVREPGKRTRTPKHIHIIADLYMKGAKDPDLTSRLVDFVISQIIQRVSPSTTNPPTLQVHAAAQAQMFTGLDHYGEYSVDYLLNVVELIAIQEKTNYTAGTVTLDMFTAFRNSRLFGGDVDLYSVISIATWRGPSGS